MTRSTGVPSRTVPPSATIRRAMRCEIAPEPPIG